MLPNSTFCSNLSPNFSFSATISCISIFVLVTSQTEKENKYKIFDDSGSSNCGDSYDDDGSRSGNGGGDGDSQRHQNLFQMQLFLAKTIHNKFNQKPLHSNGNKLSAFSRFLSSFGTNTLIHTSRTYNIHNCEIVRYSVPVHFNELQANHFRHFTIIVWS